MDSLAGGHPTSLDLAAVYSRSPDIAGRMLEITDIHQKPPNIIGHPLEYAPGPQMSSGGCWRSLDIV
jgi:hypothetical protein